MIKIFKCRRSSLALICIVVLGVLGWVKGADVAASIATIAIGIGAANAFEKKGNSSAK